MISMLRAWALPRFDRLRGHRVWLALAAFAVFPWLAPSPSVAVNVLIYGLFAFSFNLLFGYMGMLSFGHAAFFGLGAYACGLAVAGLGLHWTVAIAGGIAVAALAALAIGYLAIRTRGIYFAMVTLALAQCVYFLVYQFPPSGGENGLRGVNVDAAGFFGLHVDLIDPVKKYYFMLIFVAVSMWLVSRMLASPFGAVVEAIRENEARTRACGYDVARAKLLLFVISGAFCGLAGALNAIHLSSVAIDSLGYQTSGLVVMICLLGGMGTFFGPFVGAAIFILLQEVVSEWTEHWQMWVGAIFMLFVLFFPKGVWGTILAKVKHER